MGSHQVGESRLDTDDICASVSISVHLDIDGSLVGIVFHFTAVRNEIRMQ